MGQLKTPTDFTSQHEHDADPTTIRPPALPDGASIWEVARDAGTLELNTSYAYLLIARDLADTSRIAVHDDRTVGFVAAYLRPQAPDTLFVWQIAVDPAMRGQHIAGRMLDSVLQDMPQIERIETTITEDNTASQNVFASVARRHHAEHSVTPLLTSDLFPDSHEAEMLHSIGPIARGT
jgi:L-2,4-diaminobutyric acid acetyltransferase